MEVHVVYCDPCLACSHVKLIYRIVIEQLEFDKTSLKKLSSIFWHFQAATMPEGKGRLPLLFGTRGIALDLSNACHVERDGAIV